MDRFSSEREGERRWLGKRSERNVSTSDGKTDGNLKMLKERKKGLTMI